jgi:hypothetical protein
VISYYRGTPAWHGIGASLQPVSELRKLHTLLLQGAVGKGESVISASRYQEH